MCIRDLPDMYALNPRACGPWALDIHIRQIPHAHVTTITYLKTFSFYNCSSLKISSIAFYVHKRTSIIIICIQGGSAEIKVTAGDILTLSTDKKFAECGDNDTIYVDYDNITKVHCYHPLTIVDLDLCIRSCQLAHWYILMMG